jgi:ribosomal protein S18 acetylase RimI-like enzyme
MHIRPATTEDLKTVITWIADGEECRTWAGPVVRFPLNPEDLGHDIEFGPGNSYSLVEDEAIIAFGQLIRKTQRRLHMARFIVAPGKRASGIGRKWCRELMALAWKKGCETITLNVYRQNVPAVKLYTAAGFREVAEKSNPDLCYMIIRCGSPSNI